MEPPMEFLGETQHGRCCVETKRGLAKFPRVIHDAEQARLKVAGLTRKKLENAVLGDREIVVEDITEAAEYLDR